MEYKDFLGEKVSRLGFGAMRFPCLENGAIDEVQVQKMIDYAMAHGVNYFDTAYPYHGGMSEIVLGKCLAKYPRESYFIADKYPGHQITESYNMEEIFEEQLKKCQVEYFDFYLLHNVYENCIDVYTDENLGIVKYFVEQKKAGRIKHLGFSTHGDLSTIQKFLKPYEKDLEFAQIQLNYLDWSLQKGKEKYEFFDSKKIPLVIMEPLRGGKLCNLPAEDVEKLKKIRPEATLAEMSFNYLMTLDNAKTVLSGMSNFEQVVQNVKTFEDAKALNVEESKALIQVAAEMKKSVPCTECRYCTSSCPMKLDIPGLIRLYNDYTFDGSFTVSMKIEALPENKKPASCMHCRRCEMVCPQKINISDVMTEFAKKYETMPKWSQICKERAEAAKRLREGK